MTIGEYGYGCNLCNTSESWSTEAACNQAALWHVHVNHNDKWQEKYGDELPGPHPETLGTKFERWESQL